MRGRATPAVGLLLAVCAAACPPDAGAPGDIEAGTFRFDTELVDDSCHGDGVSHVGAFVGTLSYDSRTGGAYLSIDGVARFGTLDGRRLSVASQARRAWPNPERNAGAIPVEIDERIEGTLFDIEHSARPCTEPASVDAGPAPSSPREALLAVQLICGELSYQVSAVDADAGFAPCSARYGVAGRRE